MKLTEYTDYTLRTLIYLGLNRDRLVTIREIADAYGISKNHLMKVTQQLAQLQWVDAVRGRNGGLRLALAPSMIRIGDVVRASEGGFPLDECFDSADNRCAISPGCGLKSVLSRALGEFFRILDGHTLEDLLQNRHQLMRRLNPAATP